MKCGLVFIVFICLTAGYMESDGAKMKSKEKFAALYPGEDLLKICASLSGKPELYDVVRVKKRAVKNFKYCVLSCMGYKYDARKQKFADINSIIYGIVSKECTCAKGASGSIASEDHQHCIFKVIPKPTEPPAVTTTAEPTTTAAVVTESDGDDEYDEPDQTESDDFENGPDKLRSGNFRSGFRRGSPVSQVRTAVGSAPDDGPAIIYKRLDTYEKVWDDKGTKSDYHLSVWRAANNENDFYLLGDCATDASDYHIPPTFFSLAVKSKGDALSAPVGATLIWSTEPPARSNADVSFYQLHPAEGYTCLGDVAVKGLNNQPDLDKYRCVKDEFLVDAASDTFLWWDKNSKAGKALSVYAVTQDPADTYGLPGQHFIGTPNYNPPAGRSIKLLKDDRVAVIDVWDTPVPQNNPINVYEVKHGGVFTEMWNDHKSKAYKALTIWRPNAQTDYDLVSLGDIAVGNYELPPVGYLFKALEPDVFTTPIQFTQVYKDTDTGAAMNLIIWQPTCLSGYRALGYIATDYQDQPDYDIMRCVREDLTEPGDFHFVWDDHGTGGKLPVRVFEVIQKGGQGQDLKLMSASDSYTNMPKRAAYVLKDSAINYFSEKPIRSMEVTNVIYEEPEGTLESTPAEVTTTLIRNLDDEPQLSETEMSFTLSKEDTWNFAGGMQYGIETEITAGVPLVAESKITYSQQASFSYETGGSTTTTKEVSATAKPNVQGKSEMRVFIKANHYTTSIPYKASVKKTYFDGSTATSEMHGVYEGVEVADWYIQYGESVPIED